MIHIFNVIVLASEETTTVTQQVPLLVVEPLQVHEVDMSLSCVTKKNRYNIAMHSAIPSSVLTIIMLTSLYKYQYVNSMYAKNRAPWLGIARVCRGYIHHIPL